MNSTQLIAVSLVLIGSYQGLLINPAPNVKPSLPPAEPQPLVKPRLPFRPLFPKIEAKVGGRTEDGIELQIDFPGSLHLKNRGGRDGAGLCVFTSIEHAAHWQNLPVLQGFQKWMTQYSGGGYPSKVDQMIAKKAKDSGEAVPEYLQIENNDLELLEKALDSGRMPCVTYAYSPTGRYGGSYVAHMVNLVHGKGDTWVVLDNNFPGDTKYEWMTRKEFLRAYAGRSKGWSVVLLNPPPPPPPIE